MRYSATAATVKKPKRPSAAEMQARIEALEAELREVGDQQVTTAHRLSQSLAYQTATSDVLKVMSQSRLDLNSVFETVVRSAIHLCRADNAGIYLNYAGEYRRVVGVDVKSQDYDHIEANVRIAPGTGTVVGRAALQKRPVHIEDAWTDPLYEAKEDARIGGVHTMLGVPLLQDDTPIGVLALARERTEPFSDAEIALVTTFADQAVIAIENARLITETREALEQQTATAEVLGVINSSPGDLAPVFDAMLEKAMRLCGALFGGLQTYDGDTFVNVAVRGGGLPVGTTVRPQPGFVLDRFVHGEDIVQVTNVFDDPTYHASRAFARMVEAGVRSLLAVALRKDSVLLGTIAIYGSEARPFTDKQIALLQNFAAQAVIAMENAKLLVQLRERTDDLQQSLEYQTATGDVLKVISQSGADLDPALDRLVETAARLCQAERGVIWRLREGRFRLAASYGFPADFRELMDSNPIVPGRGTLCGRTVLACRPVQIEDANSDPDYTWSEAQRLGNFRTMLGVPLFRDGTPIGVIALVRTRVQPFTDKQVSLVATFADQAVIAIENARLVGELREREAELRATFDNMADGVAMFDHDHRLAAWNRNFQQLLQLPEFFLAEPQRFEEFVRYLAERGEFGDTSPDAEIARLRSRLFDHYSFERTRPDGTVIEVRHNPMPDGGVVLIYSDITARKRSEAEIRAARDAAEAAYHELKAAQASLVHAQKMAALGQLTAGIAHEIKNPLNFVNNFAGLSVELLDELKETATPVFADLDDDKRAEIDETIDMLTSNPEKIVEHGQRADGIVRSMLEHSRGGSGDRREVNLNALVDEALNLAYHGARAQDQSFNITMEREFDAALAPIEVVPQDVTRVFLNLIGNGFYAAAKRSLEATDGYRPLLKVMTRDLGNAIEIRIWDNGSGIASEIRDKLIQPFVTTKPTGEGTGLGLSISYEIVTLQHGGSIEVDSEPGSYTEFTVRLPRRGNGTGAENRA